MEKDESGWAGYSVRVVRDGVTHGVLGDVSIHAEGGVTAPLDDAKGSIMVLQRGDVVEIERKDEKGKRATKRYAHNGETFDPPWHT